MNSETLRPLTCAELTVLAQMARMRHQLADKEKEFERNDLARGRGSGGAGFAARFSTLYKESLSARAHAIVEALETRHRSFESPLDEGVDMQFLDWGGQALSDAYQGLEGAYTRRLQSFAVQIADASGLDQTFALAKVTVANLPIRYLWELRNVPTLRPQREFEAGPTQVIVNNSGAIGAVQTGPALRATFNSSGSQVTRPTC